ncbi:hypothetical protein Acr_17g0009310 [Actinidia rufa]|uniref:Uncharacterized protein n=1 Tax=Actinidia rufa TaxID=165716 RepID=A0A7J0G3L0_9ERIC|nr:hypothetical protein Acr_17g0009310 [Actinidia rufa]
MTFARLFKVVEKAFHITSSEYPWSIVKFLYESSLPYQGIHNNESFLVLMASIRASRCCIKAGIILVHNLNMLGNPMHLMVEALKIRSLASVRHRMSSVIQRAASAFGRACLRLGMSPRQRGFERPHSAGNVCSSAQEEQGAELRLDLGLEEGLGTFAGGTIAGDFFGAMAMPRFLAGSPAPWSSFLDVKRWKPNLAEVLCTVWNEMAVNWFVSEKGLHISGGP